MLKRTLMRQDGEESMEVGLKLEDVPCRSNALPLGCGKRDHPQLLRLLPNLKFWSLSPNILTAYVKIEMLV